MNKIINIPQKEILQKEIGQKEIGQKEIGQKELIPKVRKHQRIGLTEILRRELINRGFINRGLIDEGLPHKELIHKKLIHKKLIHKELIYKRLIYKGLIQKRLTGRGFIHISLFLLTAVFLLFSTGCSLNNRPYSQTLAFVVDDSKVYMDEMMYHVLLAAMQGELYASFVGNGENYWDMKNEDGSTMREALKEMALTNAVRYELFYQLAQKEGYTLSQEEKEQSKSKADNIVGNMGEEQVKALGLTKEKLLVIQEKIAVATKYYDSFVKKLKVDEAAVKAEINETDYKQYDIEYIYAGKENKEALEALLVKAQKTEDITTLGKEGILNSGKISFLEGDNTFGDETNLEGIILAMNPGEVSDLVETVKGYYIIKLTDNSSRTKYEQAVKEAVDVAEQKAFTAAYNELKQKHKIEINTRNWNKIDIDKTIKTSFNKAAKTN